MQIDPNIFKTYDVRGRYPEEINEEAAYRIGQALVEFLQADRLAIARDVRESSLSLFTSFMEGVLSMGCDVSDFGILPTPALYYSIIAKSLDGGAIITASHNQRGFNGIKLVNKFGTAIGIEAGLSTVRDLSVKNNFRAKGGGFKRPDDISQEYSEQVLSFIDPQKIKPFNLILDASGGSAGSIASYVFQALRQCKTTKMNFWPHDEYKDHSLNPLLEESQQSIIKQIKIERKKTNSTELILGAIWDGDGDRCILVDENGSLVEPYHLSCLLIKILLQKNPGGLIIYEPRLTMGIEKTIQKYGGRGKLIKAGRSYSEIEMPKDNGLFGCESSGHYIFKQKDLYLTDGMLPLLIILEYLSEHNLSLSKSLDEFRDQFFISSEINFPLRKGRDKQSMLDMLSGQFMDGHQSTLDGLSVDYPDWRFNLRPSNTEDLLRLNVEGISQELVDKKTHEILQFIKRIK